MGDVRIHTERLRADKVLTFTWLVWLVCVVSMPISPVFYGEVQSVALFLISNLALWIGLRTFHISARPADSDSLIEQARGTLRYLVPLGLLAFVIRVFDYFVLRGIPLFASTFAEVRQVLEVSPPTLASVAFGFLSPAMLAGGIFGVFCLANGLRTLLVFAGIALLFLYSTFSFIIGGRSTLALVGSLGLVAFILGSPRLTRRHAILAIAFFIPTLFATMVFFVTRLLESGLELSERIRISGFNKLVPLDDSVLITARNSAPWISSVMLYLLTLGQYLVHGVFEFFALVRDKNPSDPYLLGRYEFFIFDQFAKVINPLVGGDHVVNFEIYNPRTGLYTTFWGPAYIDFKYFMPLYSWTFGVLVSYFQKRVAEGDLYALPLHCLFLFQVGLSIMANGLMGAAALYANILFFAFWLYFAFWRGNGQQGQPRL
jgi:hypothetical protein